MLCCRVVVINLSAILNFGWSLKITTDASCVSVHTSSSALKEVAKLLPERETFRLEVVWKLNHVFYVRYNVLASLNGFWDSQTNWIFMQRQKLQDWFCQRCSLAYFTLFVREQQTFGFLIWKSCGNSRKDAPWLLFNAYNF